MQYALAFMFGIGILFCIVVMFKLSFDYLEDYNSWTMLVMTILVTAVVIGIVIALFAHVV